MWIPKKEGLLVSPSFVVVVGSGINILDTQKHLLRDFYGIKNKRRFWLSKLLRKKPGMDQSQQTQHRKAGQGFRFVGIKTMSFREQLKFSSGPQLFGVKNKN